MLLTAPIVEPGNATEPRAGSGNAWISRVHRRTIYDALSRDCEAVDDEAYPRPFCAYLLSLALSKNVNIQLEEIFKDPRSCEKEKKQDPPPRQICGRV